MDSILDDPHLLHAVMHDFETRKLPRTMRIKKEVDDGVILDDEEITFLKDMHHEILEYESFVETHPEFLSLYVKFVRLYCGILDTALQNEKSTVQASNLAMDSPAMI